MGDYTIMTGVHFDRATDTLQFLYTYPTVGKEDFYLLTQEIPYWHAKHGLTPAMCGQYEPVFDVGAQLLYVYYGNDGQELFRIPINKTICETYPLISRAELQASLERSANFVNANLGRINALMRRLPGTDPEIALVGASFESNTFSYIYRGTGPGSDIPLTRDEINMLRDASATQRCMLWDAYLESGFTVADVYVDGRNRALGTMVFDEQYCRPHLARIKQWQQNLAKDVGNTILK